MNELVKQIIPYRRQNSLSARHDVGQLWRVSFKYSKHSTSHMIIDWHIQMVHLPLFLHHTIAV